MVDIILALHEREPFALQGEMINDIINKELNHISPFCPKLRIVLMNCEKNDIKHPNIPS